MQHRILIVAALLLISPAAGSAQQERFLALDVFGGVIVPRHSDNGTESESSRWAIAGWDAGASLRVVRWLGLTAAGGRQTVTNVPAHHFLGGPRVTTSYGDYGMRGFAHVLVGVARAQGDQSREIVVGAGVDALYVVRFQFDYVRMNLAGLPKNNARVFAGGVLPLCFRGCRAFDKDGLNLSGR